MPSSCKSLGSGALAKLAAVGLASAALAGCSADSARLASLSSPYPASTQGSPEVTGSLGAAPTARVETAPIGSPYQAAQLPPPSAPSGPPVAYAPTAVPSVAPYSTAVQAAPRAAGSTHVVAGGETLTSIARSYGMTAAQLASTNGLSAETPLRIGQTLVVPHGTAGNLAAAAPAPKLAQPVVATAPVAPPAAKPVTAPVAVAPAAATPSAAKPVAQAAVPVAPAAAAPTMAVATAPAAKSAPAKPAATAAAEEVDDAPRSGGSGPQFRAPVRGRVISSFGPKPGGTRNDGVNFAVPEGTSVRSAEDGTVAYAGNELKGYGNLVLIKHADGYVTAYAHNSELLVKRGDTVRRGQIVAKAGQSGGVNTPQLHFEIRKGSQPVDPSQYVAGL